MVLTVGDLWQNKSEEQVWLQGGEREDRNRSIERRSIKNMKKAQKRADKSTHNASLIPHFVMLELYPKIDYIYFLLKFYTQSPKTMKWKKFAQNSCKLIQPYLQVWSKRTCLSLILKDGLCLLTPNSKLVPQDRGLKAEGFASNYSFGITTGTMQVL